MPKGGVVEQYEYFSQRQSKLYYYWLFCVTKEINSAAAIIVPPGLHYPKALS